MKPLSYRKRRDLMLKKYSALTISRVLGEEVKISGRLPVFKRGRPCKIDKNQVVGFTLFGRLMDGGYEELELDSELFLREHYDHSAFHYHYTKLKADVIYAVTSLLEKRIKAMLNEIYLHIFDSTAQSTSVREERIRGGTRNKEKLTNKFHTMLGYDPPNKIIVVEGMLASDNHTSDSKGAQKILDEKNVKGYTFGDSAFETYDLIEVTLENGLEPIYKPTNKPVRKKLSKKARLRKIWNGNHSRVYKEIRGTGECLYGAATRAGLIHTNSRRKDNQFKDELLIGLRQNLFTFFRL